MFLSDVFLNYFITIGVLLILLGIVTLFINYHKDKLVHIEIEEFLAEKKIEYIKEKNKNYDFIMKTKDRTYYVALVKIPSNSSVTINNKTTWCLRFGGSRKGRSYPNKRFLNEVEPFLRMRLPNDSDLKIVILYPSTEVILKYMNESEICEIHPSDTPYGNKVIGFDKFKSNFDDLLRTKSKGR